MIMLVPDPATFAAFETWLGTPLPADPWKALRILRKQAAQEVERLLAFLDATDGNPDLEDDDREADDTDAEPSLSWTEKEARTGRHVFQEVFDGEQEHDGREPGEDDEEGHDAEHCRGISPATPWELQQAEIKSSSPRRLQVWASESARGK